MPKPLSDDPRIFLVAVRLTQSEAEKLDRLRGGETRSDFVRRRILKGR